MTKKVLTIIFVIIFSNHTSQAQVKHAGSMGEMGKNNFQGTIHLDSIGEKSTLNGLGPYGKMQGEITVVAGQPMIAEVKDGQLVLSKSWDIEAPFFVYTNVEEWKSITKNISITNPSDLQEILESIAKEEGIDLSEPFPFRVFGDFDEITSHVVMPRSPEIEGFQAGKNQEKYNLQNIAGELLGFYSQQGQGIYTHKDSYIHVHFISEDKTIMGHLDDIHVKNQILTFMFPAKYGTIGNLKIKTIDTDFSKGRLGNQYQ